VTRSGGVAFGLAASLAWAIYNVGVAIGHQQGFGNAELTLLRYAGGAAVMLPLLLFNRVNPFAGTTPLRAALLVVVAGPPFAWAINTGYSLAPLSHAVVISPGVTMLVASALSRWVGGTPIPLHRKLGMGLLGLGLVFIASDRDSAPGPGPDTWAGTWAGDLCFVVSGTLFGVFTWLMSHWRLEAIRATGLIAIVSTLLYLPLYLALFEVPALPAPSWAQQFLYQGALGGALAVVFFTAAIAHLGSGSAAVFPALVPPMAVLCSIPMTGQTPNQLQVIGLVTATAGLLVSLDLLGKRLRRRPRRRGPATDRR
jgi:drug/metabolite transporter (DMT)-like permease